MDTVTTIDMLGKTYEVERESLTPSIHVYGVAVQNGKALVSPQFDGYDWPGGTFKLGEDTVATLKREFKEETGYEVEPIKLLGLYTSLFHHPKRKQDYHSLLIFYLVRVTGGELSDEGFDEDEKEYAKMAKWLSREELESLHHACSLDIASEILNSAFQE